MAYFRGPNIVTDGLVLYLDANNRKSINYYNLLERTERFNTGPWLKLGSPNVTVTENIEVAPNGTLTASRMVSNSNSQFGVRQNVGLRIDKTKTYTFSVWLRSNEPIQIRLDISDVIVGIANVTTDWSRFHVTSTGNLNYSDSLQFVDITFGSDLLNKSVFLWGAQLVEGTELLEYQPIDIPIINDITNNNGARLINGPIIRDKNNVNGGSLIFDGVDDLIELDDEISLNSDWTINYWQNLDIKQDVIGIAPLFSVTPQNGSGSPGFFSISFPSFTSVNSIHVDESNNIYVGGQFGGYDDIVRDTLVKINEDGSIDSNFNKGLNNGGVWTVGKIQQLSNGTIVSSTTNLGTGTGIMLNNPNNGQTISFTNAAGSRICTSFILKESSNSIYVLDSWATTYQNQSLNGKIFKLDLTNGNIDTNFDSSTGFKSTVGKTTVSTTEGVNDGIVLQDGNLLCVGTFREYKGVPCDRIVKINSTTAALDSSFVYGTGFNNTTSRAIQMNDGTIVVVGLFTNYNGTNINRIVGLNNDGSINTNFNVGTGFNNTVNSVIYDPINDKLFCFGLFTSYRGTTANRIVKINSDGSIDNSFNYGTGFDSTTNDGALDTQGRLLVLGGPTFRYQNQILPRRICRINSDGSIDTTFISKGFNVDRFRQDTQPRLINNTVPIIIGFFNINGNREIVNQPGGVMDFNGFKYYTISFNSDTNQIFTYINGNLRRTHNLTAQLPLRCKTIRSFQNFYKLSIHDRLLSQTEIQQNFNATKGRFNL
jgi:hypothetical protein